MNSILLPVGPGTLEVDRMRETLRSVILAEPEAELALILIDDNPEPRELADFADWRGPVTVLRTPLWEGGETPRLYNALVAGSLFGLREASLTDASFVLKLDTDAHVLGPFVDKISSAFAADPAVGIVGSCLYDCVGSTRLGLRMWGRRLFRTLADPRSFRHQSRRYVTRTLLRACRQPGYRLGYHCLGGAYAVGNGALGRARWADWEPWASLDISEDVIVSALVAAAGFEWRDLTRRDEVFALEWQGLPAEPAWIVRNGYSIVHSVKCQTWAEELELRQSFDRVRPGSE